MERFTRHSMVYGWPMSVIVLRVRLYPCGNILIPGVLINPVFEKTRNQRLHRAIKGGTYADYNSTAEKMGVYQTK